MTFSVNFSLLFFIMDYTPQQRLQFVISKGRDYEKKTDQKCLFLTKQNC
jgi:hypothetical protein